MYKQSKYNILSEFENHWYLWNTYSGALAKLDSDGLAFYNAMRFGEADSLTSAFLSQGFIVPVELDETARVLFEEKRALFDTHPKGHSYIIAPSMRCNYDCVYCFEQGKRNGNVMSGEIQDGILKLIKKSIDNNPSCEYVYVTWFGGEPLLQKDLIYELSKRIIALCDESGIEYIASVITNGRYLDHDCLDKLMRLGVKYVQITLDGMPDLYCKLKRASKDDFDAVVRNLELACRKLPVSLRINTDLSDKASVLQLIDHLFQYESIQKNAVLHLANIDNFHTGSNCESFRFSRGLLEFTEEIDIRLRQRYGSGIRYRNLVSRKKCPCKMARSTNACIAPDGFIYRCAEQINNKEYAVGNVLTGLYFNEIEAQFGNFSHPLRCQSCPLLPVCMGYCTRDVIAGRTNIECEALIEHAMKSRIISAIDPSWIERVIPL